MTRFYPSLFSLIQLNLFLPFFFLLRRKLTQRQIFDFVIRFYFSFETFWFESSNFPPFSSKISTSLFFRFFICQKFHFEYFSDCLSSWAKRWNIWEIENQNNCQRFEIWWDDLQIQSISLNKPSLDILIKFYEKRFFSIFFFEKSIENYQKNFLEDVTLQKILKKSLDFVCSRLTFLEKFWKEEGNFFFCKIFFDFFFLVKIIYSDFFFIAWNFTKSFDLPKFG